MERMEGQRSCYAQDKAALMIKLLGRAGLTSEWGWLEHTAQEDVEGKGGRALGSRGSGVLQGCLSVPGSQPWVVLSSCLQICHWLHSLQTEAVPVTRCCPSDPASLAPCSL